MTLYCKTCNRILDEKEGYYAGSDGYYCNEHIPELHSCLVCKKKYAKKYKILDENGEPVRFKCPSIVAYCNECLPAVKERHPEYVFDLDKSRQVYEFDMDSFYGDGYPTSSFDIGGLGHRMIVNIHQKEEFLTEMTNNFKKDLENALEVIDWVD